MNNEFSERFDNLCEQRRVQQQSALQPQWPEQSPLAGTEPSTPAQPGWIYSPWFAEWKRLAGITA